MSDAARWKATVYVGGLSQMVTTGHILDAFIPFGEIVDCKLPKPEAPNSGEAHRGFAYVEYEDAADAKEAIDNMDQSEFSEGSSRFHRPRHPRAPTKDWAVRPLSGKRKVGWLSMRRMRMTDLEMMQR
ncbi:hypothetical protein NW754_006867 [Fusarium falciforme]|nr:hypothetical protein NW754_006867 [Fusarium falciforme]